MEALKIERLSKSFGGLDALRDVSLSVEEGERRAIIGPNGAGKTTLFNLLTGEMRPSAGRIHIFGHDVTSMSQHQRVHLGLGRTFQLLNLFPNLTVLNNTALAIQASKSFRFDMFHPMSSYNSLFEEARELLGQWNLWEKRNFTVRDLSYGDQRRMELILSLASKPRLVMLDEPTAGLSPGEIASFFTVIRSLGRDITLIIVEHDMDVVFNLSERITVLHHGQVIAEGTKEEIKTAPNVREVYLGIERKAENVKTG